jgi:hypothetical protein
MIYKAFKANFNKILKQASNEEPKTEVPQP